MIHSGNTGRGGALVRMLGPAACLILFGLLMYGFIDWLWAAKRVGGKAICQSNLKQLGVGLAMYVADHDDKLPPAGRWQDSTFPYVMNAQIYDCLARPETKPGYALNQRLEGMNTRTAARPEQTVLLFESDRGQRNGADRLASFITPHSVRMGNICFLDGHVKACTAPPSADVPLKKSAR